MSCLVASSKALDLRRLSGENGNVTKSHGILGNLIDLLFFCQKNILLLCIREAFNVNPRDAVHMDLKLAEDGAT